MSARPVRSRAAAADRDPITAGTSRACSTRRNPATCAPTPSRALVRELRVGELARPVAARRRTAAGSARSARRPASAGHSAPGGAARAAEAPRARARRAAPRSRGAGKRNAQRSSTTQTALSQPSASSRADEASSSGNCSPSSARTSVLVDRDVGVPLRHRPNLPRAGGPLCEAARPCTGSSRPSRSSCSASRPSPPPRGDVDHRADGLHGRGPRSSASRRSGSSIRPRPASRSRSSPRRRSPWSSSPTRRASTCSALRGALGVPTRLLGIGLPLTILARLRRRARAARRPRVAGGARPRDHPRAHRRRARSGGRHVADACPSRIRQSLNVESGLNDGICVPLFLIALAIAQAEEGAIGNGHAAELVLEKIGYGIVGRRASRARPRPPSSSTQAAVASSTRRGSRSCRSPARCSRSACAEAIGGSGLHRGVRRRQRLRRAAAASRRRRLVPHRADRRRPRGGHVRRLRRRCLLGPALGDLTWQIALYAVLSLTVVRMLPVAIAMLGTGARRRPSRSSAGSARVVRRRSSSRSSSSRRAGSPHDELILTTVFVTVGLSVLAHGATAAPLATRYADWLDAQPPAERAPSSRRGEPEVRWRLEHEPEP